jgi:hypothetical protein
MSPTLFDVDEQGRAIIPEPRARLTDRGTSHAAAKSVRNQTVTHDRIVEVLDRYGPATDEEIAAYYFNLAQLFDWPQVSPSGLRSRRAELVDLGRIVDTGEKGRTKSGRSCTVWDLADRSL